MPIVIVLLTIAAFILIVWGKVQPNPHIDLFYIGVLILAFLHLVAVLSPYA